MVWSVRDFSQEPVLQRMDRIVSVISVVILFITALIYAGVRGHYAYVHEPDTQSNFIPASPMAFPAVAVCPVRYYVTPVAAECMLETKGVKVQDCMATVTTGTTLFEGLNLQCIIFNNISVPSARLQSTSNADEFVVSISMNPWNLTIGDDLAAVVTVFEQGLPSYVNMQSSFIADVNKFTEVWLQRNVYDPISSVTMQQQQGYSQVLWQAKTSGGSLRQPSVNPSRPYTRTAEYSVDIDFLIAPDAHGYYQIIQYFRYTPDNWIGEVGGLTALFWYLHWAFMELFMLIVATIYRRRFGDSRSRKLNNHNEDLA